jgi:hypothetical protein
VVESICKLAAAGALGSMTVMLVAETTRSRLYVVIDEVEFVTDWLVSVGPKMTTPGPPAVVIAKRA